MVVRMHRISISISLVIYFSILATNCDLILQGQKLRDSPVTKLLVDSERTFTPPILDTNNVTKRETLPNLNCPELEASMDHLTQDAFTQKLTDSCRYDRLIKPATEYALKVFFQIDVKHIETVDNLQFLSHILVQLKYRDRRLRFEHLSPNRGDIMGQEPLRNRIWVPHIIVKNERDSSLMGLDGKDIFVKISPSGDVTYSYRMTTKFYCWMNLQKFPFDHQLCKIAWYSWSYNTSNLDLVWMRPNPYVVASNLHLTEFALDKKWTEKTTFPAPFADDGGLGGEFSAVVFKFKLRREVGFYILDFFLPSVLLVVMSWVTFWIQADVAPARVTLGTATMLSFITLSGNVNRNLPKVSYVKASEIWFFGCATFIFCSLAEFAFVNVIWRRKKKVELLKQTSKNILKAGLSPRMVRRELRKSDSYSSLEGGRQGSYLNIHGGSSGSLNVPTITTEDSNIRDSATNISLDTTPPTPTSRATWTEMSPHEIAIWIDRKARLVFPICFLIFNLFYWSFVYAL